MVALTTLTAFGLSLSELLLYLYFLTLKLLTMIIYIVTPFGEFIAKVLITFVLRCFDRKCSFDENSTKKTTQEQYNEVNLDPEFSIEGRYAQLLNILFVCFLYSSGLPLLYFSGFLTLLVTYWLDKFNFFKCSRNVPYIDVETESLIRKILHFSVVLHLLISIWIYGNSNLVRAGETLNWISLDIKNYADSKIAEFIYRLTLKQNVGNLIIIGFLLLNILWGILSGILLGPLSKICFCFGNSDEKKKENLLSTSNKYGKVSFAKCKIIYQLKVLKDDQLDDEIKLVKFTIKNLKNRDLKNYQEQRLEYLQMEKKTRESKQISLADEVDCRFIDEFSYDIRADNDYKETFKEQVAN